MPQRAEPGTIAHVASTGLTYIYSNLGKWESILSATELQDRLDEKAAASDLTTAQGQIATLQTATSDNAAAIEDKADRVGLKLYIRDAAGTPHYWQITVSTLGVLTTADAGTSVPSDGIVIHA